MQILKDIIPHLVNEDHGIVKYIEEWPRKNHFSDFFYYKAILGNTGIQGNQMSFPTAGGVAIDRDRALAKAIGESIERYCSAIYATESLFYGSYLDFSDALHPNGLKLYLNNQFEQEDFTLVPFTESSIIYWSSAIRLSTQKYIKIPSSLVYCPYLVDKEKGELRHFETISTGLASHITFERAAINGILEVVERDAFMCFWMMQLNLPKVNLSSLNPRHLLAIEKHRKAGYSIDIRVLTSDAGIPTIILIMQGHTSSTVPLVLASATCLDPSDAILKGLEELSLMERFTHGRKAKLDPSQPVIEKEVISLFSHVDFWLNPNRELPTFLTEKTEAMDLCELSNIQSLDPNNDLANLVKKIESTDHEIYISDVTTEDIRPLGMTVVRAVISGYLPLNKRNSAQPLGAERLQKEMQRRRITSDQLNPLPHPFA